MARISTRDQQVAAVQVLMGARGTKAVGSAMDGQRQLAAPRADEVDVREGGVGPNSAQLESLSRSVKNISLFPYIQFAMFNKVYIQTLKFFLSKKLKYICYANEQVKVYLNSQKNYIV